MGKVPQTVSMGSIIVILLAITFEQTQGECVLDSLNVTLYNTCDWSNWLRWNCTCCGNDVVNERFAIRKRAVCCNKSEESLSNCLLQCGYNLTADTQYGGCQSSCVNKTSIAADCGLDTRITTANSAPWPYTAMTSEITSHISASPSVPIYDSTSNSTTLAVGRSTNPTTDDINIANNNKSSDSANTAERQTNISFMTGGVTGGVAFIIILVLLGLLVRARKARPPTIRPNNNETTE